MAMDILEVLRSYETLKSYGLCIPFSDLLPIRGVGGDSLLYSNKKVNEEGRVSPKSVQPDSGALQGNILRQSAFLNDLLSQKEKVQAVRRVLDNDNRKVAHTDRDKSKTETLIIQDDVHGEHGSSGNVMGEEETAMTAMFDGNLSDKVQRLGQIRNSGIVRNNQTVLKEGNPILAQEGAENAGTEINEHVIVSSANTTSIQSEKKTLSFKDALINETSRKDEDMEVAGLKPLPIPRYEGGNLVIDLDEEDYRRGVEELKYSVVGRLFLQRGCDHPTTMEIKSKLSQSWGTGNFKVVPLGGSYFHVVLQSMDDQCTVLANGPVNVSPGIFRVSRWQPGFDPTSLRSTTQVWVRLYGIPLEFRKEQNLLNIAAAVGTPLKIDPATISMYTGLYARVLVDVDVSKNLPEKVLASLKTEKKDLNISFFVNFKFEKLPSFCALCKVIGHDRQTCRKQNLTRGREEENTRHREVTRTVKKSAHEVNGCTGGRVNSNNSNREENNLPTDKEHDIAAAVQHVSESNNGAEDANLRLPDTEGIIQVRPQHKYGRPSCSSTQSLPAQATRETHGASVNKHLHDSGTLQGDNVALNSVDSLEASDSPRGSNDLVKGRNFAGDFSGFQYRHAKGRSSYLNQGSGGMGLSNRFEHLGNFEQGAFGTRVVNASSDQIVRQFPEDTDSVIRAKIREENIRKEEEWERTKVRLEDSMQADMMKRKEKQKTSSSPPPPPPPPPKTKSWFHSTEEDEAQEAVESSSASNTSRSDVPESDSPVLDPEKIYWDEDNEVFYHASGMYYDPEVKTYYSLVDQKGGDLRPIYYVQAGGDFFVAQKGKLGQSNKVLMDDKSWSNQAIYSIKSPRYKHGLLKMFKEKIKEGTT